MAKYTLGGIFAGFMESIHIELANKRIYLTMSEMMRKYDILKLIYVFDNKLLTGGSPKNDFIVFCILNMRRKLH